MKRGLKLPHALRAAGVLLFLVFPASAQRVSSDILGTVTDVSDRIIVGAKITATRSETGEEREVKTNEDGNYRISGLSPGTYEIQVEYPGFRTLVRKDINLLVSQNVVVDLTLQVGELRQKVEVSGQPSLLESASSELSGVVTDKTLRQLPLNGRDLFQLTLLQTGVLPTTNAGPNPFAERATSNAAVHAPPPPIHLITLTTWAIHD